MNKEEALLARSNQIDAQIEMCKPHPGALGERQKPWVGQLLTIRTNGGYCSACRTRISHHALSDRTTIYTVHKDHIRRVVANCIVVAPAEYCGLNLQVPIDILPNPGTSTIPCIIVNLSCHQCCTDIFPSGMEDVSSFRSAHSDHIYHTSIEVVGQTAAGKVISSEFPIRGQQETAAWSRPQNPSRQSADIERLKQLEKLCHCLICLPYGLSCRLCNSQHYFARISEAKLLLAYHEDHIRGVSILVDVAQPREFESVRLKLPGELVTAQSLSESLAIDCIMLELSSVHAKHSLVPWGLDEMVGYLEITQNRGVKLRMLLRGNDGLTFKRLVTLGLRPPDTICSNRTYYADKQPAPGVTTRGIVKCFSKRGGYGFIKASNGDEIFCHFTAIKMAGFKCLREGEEVEFEIVRSRGGLEAAQVFRVEG